MFNEFSNNQTVVKEGIIEGGEQIKAEELKSMVDRVNNINSDMKEQRAWVYAGFITLVFVVVGLLIAVYAILIDYMANKQAIFENMKDQMLRQNIQLEILNQDMQKILSRPTK